MIDGSARVIFPGTLQVNPGTVFRVKIGEPIDPACYERGDKQRLMEDVYRIMSRDPEELERRRRPDEEQGDPVYRWIHKG